MTNGREKVIEIMDAMPVICFMKDATGKYLYVNPAYLTTLKLTKDSVIGKTDYDIFPRMVADELIAHDKNVLSDSRPIATVESVPVSERGNIYFLVSKFIVKNGGVCVGGIAMEIPTTIAIKLTA